MIYMLVNNFGGYFKRLNKFNVAVCDGIGMGKTFKYRYQADFTLNELKEDFKVLELTEEEYVKMYNRWYEMKYTYQENKNEIYINIK